MAWKQILKRSGKLSCAIILASTIGTYPIIGGSGTTTNQIFAEQIGPKIEKRDESYITSGAKLVEYKWTAADGERSSDVRVVEIDLHNPHVEVDVMTGQHGKVATRNTVRGMAVQSGAVAGVNGDFYVMAGEGASMGPQVTSGELVASPSKLQGMYAFGITADNVPVIERFDFSGMISNDHGAYYPLSGINKTNYWTEPDKTHSHVDAIYIYTSDWGRVSRAGDGMTTPTEMLVIDDVVEQFSVGQAFDMTPPEGGYIVRAHRRAAEFLLENFQVGDNVQLEYDLRPINPSQSFDANSLKMLIGGHTLLVNEGKAANYTRNVSSIGGSRARTGVGYSKDGRYAYLITVDGGSGNSGIHLGEFRQLMVELGVWKGLNLDGGGSTQLVSRPLGDTQVRLTNRPEFVTERQVVNGIGIYTNAPEGPVKDMILQGKDTLLIGEASPYSLKAYDVYYNPKKMQDDEVTWSASSGAFSGNVFTPTRPGRVTLTAKSDDVERSLGVDVLGYDQVKSLTFDVKEQSLPLGKFVDLPLKLTSKADDTFDVPVRSVDWDFYGFVGTVSDQGIRVDQVTAEDGLAQIVARYDDFSTIIAMNTGIEKPYTDFSTNRPNISFTGYPNSVEGSTQIVYGLPGMVSGQRTLQLNYDFSKGEAGVTKAAYAVFNDDKGIELEGEPMQMNLRMKGDNSLNWLRAEVVDAKGKKHLVDIDRNMNDVGMTTVSADFTAYNMSYPVKLTRIYVASPAERQEEREVSGSVLIDSISFVYPREQTEQPKTEIQLQVGKSSMTVNGVDLPFDQAPVVVDGRTLVPIRVISDALGATIQWRQDDSRVTLIDHGQLIEMWVDQLGILHNGERVTIDVAPMLKNARTLVPLRMISETFGWDVEWNQEEQTIRLIG